MCQQTRAAKRRAAAHRAAKNCEANVELGRIVAEAERLRAACDAFLAQHHWDTCGCPLCDYFRLYHDEGPRNDLIVLGGILGAFPSLIASTRPMTDREWDESIEEFTAEQEKKARKRGKGG